MLHKRLQTLRKQKGFSQKEMADKLHKSPSAYSRMESGDIKITLEELPVIAGILECTINDLLQQSATVKIQQVNETVYAQHVEAQNNNSEEMVKQLEILLKQVIDHQAKSEERMQAFMKALLESLKKLMPLFYFLKQNPAYHAGFCFKVCSKTTPLNVFPIHILL